MKTDSKQLIKRNVYVAKCHENMEILTFSSVKIRTLYSLVRMFAKRKIDEEELKTLKFRYTCDGSDNMWGTYHAFVGDEEVSSIPLRCINYYNYEGLTYYEQISQLSEEEAPPPDLTYDGLVIEFDLCLLENGHLYEDDAKKITDWLNLLHERKN